MKTPTYAAPPGPLPPRLINGSSCHCVPLKCTWLVPQSVQHIVAYGDFTVHSQPTANISQFRSEKTPSVKRKS